MLGVFSILGRKQGSKTQKNEMQLLKIKVYLQALKILDKCLSGSAFIFQPNKSPKYCSVWLNIKHLANLGGGHGFAP